MRRDGAGPRWLLEWLLLLGRSRGDAELEPELFGCRPGGAARCVSGSKIYREALASEGPLNQGAVVVNQARQELQMDDDAIACWH
jgi:hypothetical protein